MISIFIVGLVLKQARPETHNACAAHLAIAANVPEQAPSSYG